MLEGNDLEVASGCREDVNLPYNRLQRDHLKAFHACLQSANWINLCDQDTSSCPTHSKRTSLTHITVSANQSSLSSDHDVRCPHDTIWKRMPAAVYVDCWKEQFALCSHFLKSVYTRAH